MSTLAEFSQYGAAHLTGRDPQLGGILEMELARQQSMLSLIASSSITPPSVLFCEGFVGSNVTAEGYPGKRYHAGCSVVDQIENLAIDRAKVLFGASYVNVQPHSASSANISVLLGLLAPGDSILGMDLKSGGHLSHGSPVSISGRIFQVYNYGVDAGGCIDFNQVRELALKHRPKLIICGATAHPRQIDFVAFRRIADEAGSLLLADISHIAGLIAAGRHPSPIDQAHVVTTCTHKQLYGPRGGLIMMGREADAPLSRNGETLKAAMQKSVFPLLQGAPIVNAIAAKAAALRLAMLPEFRENADRILENALALANAAQRAGYGLVSSGTDTHIVMVSLLHRGITGIEAQQNLERAGVIVNRNVIPGDPKPANVTSGLRLGTNAVAYRRMGPGQMRSAIEFLDRVINAVETGNSRICDRVISEVREAAEEICAAFPIPLYPASQTAAFSVRAVDSSA